MKSFVLKTIGFISALLMLLLLVVKLSVYGINKKANFVIPEDIHSIIMGHSHPEMAYNDTLINGFKNLGHSAETYFHTYFKLKKVIADNPKIKNVYLEFSNEQIESSMNYWIWGDEYMDFRYPIYGAFIDGEGQRLLASHNSSSYLNVISKGTYNNYLWLVKKDFKFLKLMGGYKFTKRATLDSLLNTDFENSTQYFFSKSQLSTENLNYAQKIIEFCKVNSIDIILIRTPQHSKLPILRNEKQFQHVRDSLFSDLEFMDFTDFELSSEEFSDLDHLNYKGARRFSKWFNELMLNKE